MDVGCILEMVSSYLRNPMTRLADEKPPPEKVSVVRPLEELTLAIQGERIWHEEKWQYRIHPLLEWLAAWQ